MSLSFPGGDADQVDDDGDERPDEDEQLVCLGECYDIATPKECTVDMTVTSEGSEPLSMTYKIEID